MWSRHGTDLTRYVPDLLPALRALPDRVALDGELVVWDAARGKLDFTSLSRRISSGSRLAAYAERHPAHLVVFDALADGADLRRLPLAERRLRLAAIVSEADPAVVLGEQTTDLDTAARWMHEYTAGGLEGLLIKRSDQSYPTGRRSWWKYRVRTPLDLVVLAVSGDVRTPDALLLGAFDPAAGRLVAAGASTRLTRATAREVGRHLAPTGRTARRRLGGLPGTSEATLVRFVEPVVAEVDADITLDQGKLRHLARLLRLRPDLPPEAATLSDIIQHR